MLLMILEILYHMYYRFDVRKWILHQLPVVLRKTLLFAFLKSIVEPIRVLHREFEQYASSSDQQLMHNSQTLMMQKWLNDVLYLEQGTIYITNYLNDQVYMHYAGEKAEDLYMCNAEEGDSVYLKSQLTNEYGGFVVNVPAQLATADNIQTIRKWVEYYKAAGTVYKIISYE